MNVKAIRTGFKNIWRLRQGLVVRELEKNLFVIQFFSMKDKEFVLNEGPRVFDGSILLMKEWMDLE